MADPTMQTFCCLKNNETDEGLDILLRFNPEPYNAVCIASSLVGIGGAIFQILPRRDPPDARRRMHYSIDVNRGRKIVIWLAVADLLSSLAVLVRAVSWLKHETLIDHNDTLSTIVCAVLSGFIQYFYMATWLWTLCYAIDIQLVLKEKSEKIKVYHAVCWGVPLIFCSIGLSILYIPDINCHHLGSNAFVRVLPNYLLTFVPILVVMIANPILYFTTSQEVKSVLVRSTGRFTHQERQIANALQVKFFCINATFYVCWLPNTINGIVLWSMWNDLPRIIVLTLWYIMAVMNPLQALLNCLVYQRWGEGAPKVFVPWMASVPFTAGSAQTERETLDETVSETSPLLDSSQMNLNRGRHSINGFQKAP